MRIIKKLSRNPIKRESLIKNLLTQLVLHDRIITTLPRAKETRRFADHVVTLMKKNNMEAISKWVQFPEVTVKKLEIMKHRYSDRQSGFTRIIPYGVHPVHKHKRAILEYINAPEDTIKKLGDYQAPLLLKKQSELQQQLKDLNAKMDLCRLTFSGLPLKPSELPKIPQDPNIFKLKKKIQAIEKRIQYFKKSILTKEQKFPPKGYQICVEKRFYYEQLPPRIKKTREEKIQEFTKLRLLKQTTARIPSSHIYYRDKAEKYRNPDYIREEKEQILKPRVALRVKRTVMIKPRIQVKRKRIHNQHLYV